MYLLKTEILHFLSLKSAVYTWEVTDQERVIVARVWYLKKIDIQLFLLHSIQILEGKSR